MASAARVSLLGSILDLLPEEQVSEQVRSRLDKLQERLDKLFFLDETPELAVDRQGFIALASDGDLVPAELREVTILETAKHLGRRLKELREGRRITWLEAGQYGPPIQPAVDELRKFGLNKSMSTRELGAALRKWYPTLPKDLLELDSSDVYQRILKNLGRNQTVWDCLVANLGWWAAINVIGTLTIALIMLSSGVPWPWVLVAIIAFTALFTAEVILNCALNPYYQIA